MSHPAPDSLPGRRTLGRPAPSDPATLEPAMDARLRVLLANTPLPEPEPQRVRRWQARLAVLRTPTRRRYRVMASAAGLLAAALAAGVAALASTPAGGLPGARPAAEPPILSRDQLPRATPTGLDLGTLTDPATRAACLAGAGAVGEPLAARPVVLDGRRGELLVLPTGRPGRLRLLVVADGCGPAGTEVLVDDTVGR